MLGGQPRSRFQNRQGARRRAKVACSPGMTFVPGGRFRMGSDNHYPDEAPVRMAEVGDFWIDIYPVTNREFADFVTATGYRTLAEIAPSPKDFPGMPPELAHPGSAVFVPPAGPAPASNSGAWWSFVLGANWRHPAGPASCWRDIPDHPVVQIAYGDAAAFAEWAGKAIPTEAEWELAARGGKDGATYAWGEELAPDGQMLANYWQGEFPWENLEVDGFERTSPVGSFLPNEFGLYDMIGNVWEWTADWYSTSPAAPSKGCCAPPEWRRARKAESLEPDVRGSAGRRVLKGGSHLCAPNYCQRYRPAARFPQPVDSPTSHIGFRCVTREKAARGGARERRER